MRGRTVLIMVALACVVVVVIYLVLNLNAPAPGVAGPKARPSMVIIAANALPVGTLIKPQDLSWGTRPADAGPGTVFERNWADNDADQAALDGRTQIEVIGAVSRRRIEQGEAITKASVVKPGDSGFLAAVLKPGMRAITVGVTVVTGTAGLIYPGDHVDMILTQNFNATGADIGKKSAAETIAQDLRVLAIDQQLQVKTDPNAQNTNAPGKVPATVTLEVVPDEANHILVASKLGELSLTIRSLDQANGTASAPAETPASSAPVWADQTSQALDTIAKAAIKNEPPPEPPKPKILVIRGAQSESTGVH
jgi:pilus assembly protein CpaB